MRAAARVKRELSATGLAAAQAAIGGGRHAAKLIERLRARNLALQERRAEILRTPAGRRTRLRCATLPRLRDTGYIGRSSAPASRSCCASSPVSLGDTSGMRDCRLKTSTSPTTPSEPCGPYNVVPRRAMEKVLSACREYAHLLPQSESLLFLGGTGLGKTHLSLAIS
ncbi:MAG: hypothetical protein ACLVL7_00750 [Anaerotruncus massiliensis (ex Togo et al. 2019)]